MLHGRPRGASHDRLTFAGRHTCSSRLGTWGSPGFPLKHTCFKDMIFQLLFVVIQRQEWCRPAKCASVP